MAVRTVFDKQLGAASSNNIAATQAGSAGVPLVLNGSASNYLSTTATAAVANGGVVVPLASVTGLVAGQSITDTTAAVIPTGTTIAGVGTSGVSLSQPVGGVSGIGSGDTIVFAGTAKIDAVTSANDAVGRQVAISYTGTDTSFTIVGTGATGNVITDTAVGVSGVALSNLNFVTVSSITPVGGGLTGVTAGTNGVGASPWVVWNWRGYSPMTIGFVIELVSGAVNFTVQHTYDDPNALSGGALYPLALNHTTVQAQNATIDGSYDVPIIATRVLINSGTGQIRCRFEQAGIG
jgi:hypothetical protein